MKPIQPGQIRVGDGYQRVRDQARRQVSDDRRHLRVALDGITIVFENRLTIASSLEEACRAERVVDAERVAAETEAFNRLVPEDGELAACLYLDAADQAELGGRLAESAGVERAVYLDVAGSRAPAVPEAVDPGTPMAAVLLRFPLSQEQCQDVRSGAELAIGVDHPAFRRRVPLTGAQRAAIAAGLD